MYWRKWSESKWDFSLIGVWQLGQRALDCRAINSRSYVRRVFRLYEYTKSKLIKLWVDSISK